MSLDAAREKRFPTAAQFMAAMNIAARTGMTGRSGQKCDRRRRQRCALMRTEQHVCASARSTGGFNRLRGRDARFAVAQDARGSDSSLATTWNPVDVGLRASGRKAFWRLRYGPGGYVLARQGVTGTRISTVTPAARSYFAREQDNLTAAYSDEKRAKGEKCHDRPI